MGEKAVWSTLSVHQIGLLWCLRLFPLSKSWEFRRPALVTALLLVLLAVDSSSGGESEVDSSQRCL